MSLPAGARLGPYEVLGPLGAGGMGEVYKARDGRLLRTVAIKVLSSSEPHRGERFAREARALSRLSHPHVCAIHDVGEHEGAAFLVMEYLEGETLAERLEHGPLPLDTALRYAVEMTGAVAEAHRQGLIHRDLKPSNVMLTRDGAKVLDFGLAKLVSPDAEPGDAQPTDSVLLTGEGEVMGTVAYMSPEQLEGKALDERTDLFALGTMFFEMVTGRRAFEGESRARVVASVLTRDPPPLSVLLPKVPPALEHVVSKCLAKDPEQRWQSARDLESELQWIREGASETRPPPPKARASPRGGRFVLLGAALLACALGAGGILAWEKSRHRDPSFERVTFGRGHLFTARFAPDGRTVVYSAAWDGRPHELFSARQGSTESRLLGYPRARIASISHSGEMALLIGPGGPDTLARVPLAGGAPRELLERVLDADWMVDGSALAVLRLVGPPNTSATYTVEFPLGRVVLESYTPIWFVRVSATGDLLAGGGVIDGQGSVFVIDRSGGKSVLSKGWAVVSSLAWAPHGDEIWFTGTRVGEQGAPHALWAVTLSGDERLVTRAPVGYRIHDVVDDGRILLEASDSRSGLLCGADGVPNESELGWLAYSWIEDVSADGKTIVFAAGASGRGPRDSAPSIYLRGTDGSPAIRLGEGYPLRLSPDGKWVLAVRADRKAWFVLPTRAGTPRDLPAGAILEMYGGDWLDSGRIVLWGRENGLASRVYAQDIETGALTPVGPDRAFPSRHGLVTPDRKAFLAMSNGRWSRYPLDGSAPTPIPLERLDEPLQWSPDGRSLYLLSAERDPTAVEVHRLDVVNGRREVFKTLSPPDSAGVQWIDRVVITPDGRSYCYTYSQTLANLYVAEGLR